MQLYIDWNDVPMLQQWYIPLKVLECAISYDIILSMK